MIFIIHNIGCLFPDAYLRERDEPVLGEIQCKSVFSGYSGKRSINPHPWLGGIPEVEMEGDPLSLLIICKRREPVALDAVLTVVLKGSLD